MNTSPTSGRDWKVPREMIPFVAKYPRLLPGESEKHYHALFVMMVDEIEPQHASEWLVLADIVELFWDIGRYRAWKSVILSISRREALQTALQATNRDNAVTDDMPALIARARKDAEEWRTDPAKREALNKRLLDHGYDEEALNAGALLAALVPLATIDRFLASARGQLNAMLKEISVRREFAERANKAFKEQLQRTAVAPETKQIGAH